MKGLIDEQNATVSAFLVTFVSVYVSIISIFWIMMPPELAAICSTVNALGFLYHYHVCLRIYNRFYIDNTVDDSEAIDFDGSKSRDDENPSTGKPGVKSTWRRIFSFGHKDTTYQSLGGRAKEQIEHSSDAAWHERDVFSGWVTTKVKSFFGWQWKRKYVVLKGSEVMCFDNREDYERVNSASIHRPVDIMEGCISSYTDGDDYIITVRWGGADGGEPLEFKLDTADEQEQWGKALLEASNGRWGERASVSVDPHSQPAPTGATGSVMSGASSVSRSDRSSDRMSAFGISFG